MSWKNQSVVEQRQEFVSLAQQGGLSFTQVCRRFSISRKTGYKWLRRFACGGLEALKDQAREQGRLSNQTARRLEAKVIALRHRQPTWGPRKLRRRLEQLGQLQVPAVSTVARILQRANLIDARCSVPAVERFCRSAPNELWQMDFKGHFALQQTGRCHPLTVLDDCSRYLLGLAACGDERALTVQTRLEHSFARYGLPQSILCDNGPPWGGSVGRHSALSVWLLRLGVQVLHGRPYHPQTQGKAERFHRTLKTDLLAREDWRDLTQAQRRFDRYRHLYNHDRPHDALALDVPAQHYRPSTRPLPLHLPSIDYASDDIVRTVRGQGALTFRNRCFYIGEAFGGLPVALRPCATDGIFRVYFQAFSLGLIDLKALPIPKGNCHPLLPDPAKV
jgi:transposase InsO family protein